MNIKKEKAGKKKIGLQENAVLKSKKHEHFILCNVSVSDTPTLIEHVSDTG